MASTGKLSELERVEMGMDMVNKLDRPEDDQLRILIFTATYFVLDGVTLTIRRLQSHLTARGAVVKILSTIPEDIDPELSRDVIAVPGIKIPFANAGDYSFGTGLDEHTTRAIEAFRPNCVHFTVPDFVALDGIRWCQKNNVAYIGTWHSNYTEYLKYYFLEWIAGPGFHVYLKGFYEQIPSLYVPTSYMVKRLKEDWGYGKCTELKEWGRGVDMSLFTPERRSNAFRASHGISEKDVVVLWVSRLVPEKRPDIWLSVVKRLQEEGLPVKALVVGSGTFEKYLSKLQHVTCLGWLSGPALGEAYSSSDVLLFPSDVETFGNVTLEALSSGCPCVVEKKCGGHLVENGVNGYTCTSGDTVGFYESMRKIVTDTQLRQEMSEAARKSAWKYERNIILQQMAENYKDAIVKHRDPLFMRRHLEKPAAAGKNMLSYVCCNYSLAKSVAEPFLNTTRGVQDIVDGSTECLQMSRSRLNCSVGRAEDWTTGGSSVGVGSSSAGSLLGGVGEGGKGGGGMEEGMADKSCDAVGALSMLEGRNEDNSQKKYKRFSVFSLGWLLSSERIEKFIHYFSIVLSSMLIVVVVYASFTV